MGAYSEMEEHREAIRRIRSQSEIQHRTFVVLTGLYGYNRASDIVMGKDPATNADVARWNSLGTPIRTGPL